MTIKTAQGQTLKVAGFDRPMFFPSKIVGVSCKRNRFVLAPESETLNVG